MDGPFVAEVLSLLTVTGDIILFDPFVFVVFGVTTDEPDGGDATDGSTFSDLVEDFLGFVGGLGLGLGLLGLGVN